MRRSEEPLKRSIRRGWKNTTNFLAYHYVPSDNMLKALEYLDLANQKADKANAMEDAKAYFDQAMELLNILPETEENRERRISLLVNQSIVFQMLFKSPEYYDLLTQYESLIGLGYGAQDWGAFYARLGACEYTFGYLIRPYKPWAKQPNSVKLRGTMRMPDMHMFTWCGAYLLRVISTKPLP